MNSFIRSDNKSGYKGVYYLKSECHKSRNKKWVAQIKLNGKKIIKYCLTKKEATFKYNEMAKTYFKQFAYLNKLVS